MFKVNNKNTRATSLTFHVIQKTNDCNDKFISPQQKDEGGCLLPILPLNINRNFTYPAGRRLKNPSPEKWLGLGLFYI